MGNNDISKFNGQYLKCVVTKHKGTMNALSDKGALIVYQNNNRNYAYLGNEFIASGYGFDSLDKIKEAENIINSYNNDIQGINELLDELSNDYNDTKNNLDDIVNKKFLQFDPKIHYKDTNDKVVDYNLNDIFFRGQNATYKDFEFTSIKKSIYINNRNNGIIIDESNIVELPIGTKINKIIYEFNYAKNDTGGIKKLLINYFKSYDDYNNNILQQVEYNTLANSKTDSGKLTIVFTFNKNYFYVTGSEQISIVDSIVAEIIGTSETQYKDYPNFKDIVSLENIISDHTQVFNDKIYIKPISLMYYRFNKFTIFEKNSLYYFTDNSDYDPNDLLNNKIINLAHICKNIMINQIDTNGTDIYDTSSNYNISNTDNSDIYSYVTINQINENNIFNAYIPVDNDNFNSFTFFVPVSFKIHKLSFVTKNSEYNLTGALGYIEYLRSKNGESYNEITESIYVKGILTNIESNNDIRYFYKSRIYQFTINKGKLKTNGMIKIELMCVNDNFSDDLYTKDIFRYESNNNISYHEYSSYTYFNNSIYDLGICKEWNLLNNEEFNRIHWLSYTGDINVLKDKLDFVSERVIE